MQPRPGISVELNVSAPVFNLKDVFGRPVNLESYKGKKVFIGFFRHAGCPFCNIRVHSLFKAYQGGLFGKMQFIFFFESPEPLLISSSFLKGISPIPIISDPQKIWYGNYGIENSVPASVVSHLTSFIQTAIKAKMKEVPIHLMAAGESFSTMPAEFLLDENLIVRKIHYSKGLNDRLSLEVVRTFATNP